jgi:hypothetical protein
MLYKLAVGGELRVKHELVPRCHIGPKLLMHIPNLAKLAKSI